MKVVYNNEYLRVTWKHVMEQHHTLAGGKFKTPKLVNGETTCFIQKDEKNGEVVFQGRAWCSVKEPYDKDRGRKRSLAAALQKIPKQDRLVFWLSYFQQTADKNNVYDRLPVVKVAQEILANE